MQRLFVIYNPRSSNFCRVNKEVLSKLSGLKGYVIGKYEIKKTNFDDNVATLSKLFKNGDTVIAAGGDATAAMAMNAIIKSGKNVTLSPLPYGNFNDFARIAKERQDSLFHIYPLEIKIDGKLWRYSACYVTIGMMAESTKLFYDAKIRKNLQKGHRHPWRSYLNLAKWYFKNRHKKVFLPNFTVNGRPAKKNTSDYIAINGSSMAGVMRGGEDCKNPKTFHSHTAKLTSFPRLIAFMTKSIFAKVPGDKTTGDVIKFATPNTITIQAEGEYAVFKNVQTIEITKSSIIYCKTTTTMLQ
jgi:diacylglycerol kinase family enzyme